MSVIKSHSKFCGNYFQIVTKRYSVDKMWKLKIAWKWNTGVRLSVTDQAEFNKKVIGHAELPIMER